MLPTPVGTNSGTSLLGPSLLDGNSRDSFVSRSLADVAEVSARPFPQAWVPASIPELPDPPADPCGYSELLTRIYMSGAVMDRAQPLTAPERESLPVLAWHLSHWQQVTDPESGLSPGL